MATLTIRNVPATVVSALKRIAKQNDRSMEQEVRLLHEEKTVDRESVLLRIREGRRHLLRLAAPAELDAWIEVGRE